MYDQHVFVTQINPLTLQSL